LDSFFGTCVENILGRYPVRQISIAEERLARAAIGAPQIKPPPRHAAAECGLSSTWTYIFRPALLEEVDFKDVLFL
jgi:hypothetical protein